MSDNIASFPAQNNVSQENVKDAPQDVGGVAGKQLKAFIERIERLEEEKAVLSEDIKEVFGEAKSVGFDIKIIRKLIRLRKMEENKDINKIKQRRATVAHCDM